uniref:RING-type domain-containing protein n=1 Tax=Trypanosoma congolense (strain IL3000) TaxID=1068625 RepID=G0V0B3_TRYCI|nr:conserved hypothetical protein [Trypanosoma congolense IL3000]
MAAAYVFDGAILRQMTVEKDSPKFSLVDVSLHPGSSVTCFRKDEFYFINKSAPCVLQYRGATTGSKESTLPGPAHRLLVHHQKVYCCGDTSLYVFDPLSSEVETIDLKHQVKQLEAAEHGFVFLNERCELYAFHFIQGIKEVKTKRTVTKLLGHHNRYVVALLDNDEVVSVDEQGEVHENLFPLSIRTPFTTLDPNTLVVLREEGGLALYLNGTRINLSDVEGCDLQVLNVPPSPADDACTICFCDFEDGDGIRLDCGHPFHRECLAEFSSRANSFIEKGEHIVFTYAVCPSGCGAHIRHSAAPLSAYMNKLYRTVCDDAAAKLREMCGKTLDDLYYYVCSRCEKPFYGGNRWCSRSISGEPSKKPNELICSDCNDDFLCPTHKHQFVLYKCRYCCNPATHLSFGNRYMCEDCNKKWEGSEPERAECPGADKCPLAGDHPTGGSQPLGCMLCLPCEKYDPKLFFAVTREVDN